ncbi:unnamed protein product [Clonostachys chloroleuca]|uniref:Sec20 C-terminal domain-containing protein n=1 Tax=Clonostachys chloroleuca TaxID=1926264 RepID=A0AA35LT91_9HYPO|nr:unnamed protein product [Clonostachys chloroleuca]
MSFESLQERLSALQETTSQLRELIDRLTYLKFQPGSVPLDTNEEGSVSGELSAEISQLLREGDDDQELLLEEIEFLKDDEEGGRTRLQQGVERQGKELESCRIGFRKARLAAKKSLVQAQRLERELMVKSYSVPVSEAASSPDAIDERDAPPPFQHQFSRYNQRAQQTSSLSEKDKQAVGASSRATDALRQMHASLQDELERSDYAHQTMKESSAAFQQLNESYNSLEVMLANSKDLLGTLMKSQKSDTWYLITTFYMLLIVGAWLVFRRFLYGPMWWLVWLPLRFLLGVGSTVGSTALQGRGSVGESGKVETLTGQQKVTVDGIPGDELPTAKLEEKPSEPAKQDTDSVMEEVQKVVDSVKEADELGSIPKEDTGSAHMVPEEVVEKAVETENDEEVDDDDEAEDDDEDEDEDEDEVVEEYTRERDEL